MAGDIQDEAAAQARRAPGTIRSALLIVDVQRDFCPGGALPAPGGDRILPALNRYVTQAIASGMPVYASRDWHPSKTKHFNAYGGQWPPHCVQGSPGAEFHPGLELPADAMVITKGDFPDREGYSAFDGRTAGGEPLARDLRDRHVDTVYVAGIATEYCVKQTALDGIREGFNVRVLADAISGIEAHSGDSGRALEEMVTAGARIVRLPRSRRGSAVPTEGRARPGAYAIPVAVTAVAALATFVAAFSLLRTSGRSRRRGTAEPPSAPPDRPVQTTE